MSMVWKNRDSQPPKKAKVVKLMGNVMCVVFMDSSGVILVHMIPVGGMVKEAFARRSDTQFELKYCVVQRSV